MIPNTTASGKSANASTPPSPEPSKEDVSASSSVSPRIVPRKLNETHSHLLDRGVESRVGLDPETHHPASLNASGISTTNSATIEIPREILDILEKKEREKDLKKSEAVRSILNRAHTSSELVDSLQGLLARYANDVNIIFFDYETNVNTIMSALTVISSVFEQESIEELVKIRKIPELADTLQRLFTHNDRFVIRFAINAFECISRKEALNQWAEIPNFHETVGNLQKLLLSDNYFSIRANAAILIGRFIEKGTTAQLATIPNLPKLVDSFKELKNDNITVKWAAVDAFKLILKRTGGTPEQIHKGDREEIGNLLRSLYQEVNLLKENPLHLKQLS